MIMGCSSENSGGEGWIAGLLDCWIAGWLDCWIAGWLDCWMVGWLDGCGATLSFDDPMRQKDL